MPRIFLIFLIAMLGCRTPGSHQSQAAAERTAPRRPENVASSRPERSKIVMASAEVDPEVIETPLKMSEITPERLVESEPTNLPALNSSSLTLAALEQLALGRNPTIPQAGALVRQIEGTTIQAGLYPNPTVGYLRSDPDQPGQSQTSGVFLSQEFVTAGKLRLAQQAGRYDIDLRCWQLTAQEMRVVNDVRIRFYEVLGAQQAVQAVEELKRSAADAVRIATELLEARQGGRPDILQAEMQLSFARGALQDSKYRLKAARRQLASVAGVDALSDAPVVGDPDEKFPELTWDATLQRLLDVSPLLKSQEAELQAAQTEVQLARAQAVPNVSVQIVAQRDTVQKYSSVSTLVALPVPFFNRNQGNIIHAEGILLQQQREYDRLRLALTDQLAGSFRQYSSLQSETGRLQNDVLPRAKENLDLTTQAYRLGRMDFLRVVDARRTYFQANMDHIDALTELHKVVVEIEGLQLTGGLNPTEVGTALQATGAGGTGTRGVLSQQLQEQRNSPTRNLPGVIQAGEK